jgi:hypothetical protein
VVLEVRERSRHVLSEESSSFFGAVVFFVSTTELNPLRKGLDISGKTSRGVITTSGSTNTRNARLSRFDLTFDILLLFKHLFPSDKVSNTLNKNVNERGLTKS